MTTSKTGRQNISGQRRSSSGEGVRAKIAREQRSALVSRGQQQQRHLRGQNFAKAGLTSSGSRSGKSSGPPTTSTLAGRRSSSSSHQIKSSSTTTSAKGATTLPTVEATKTDLKSDFEAAGSSKKQIATADTETEVKENFQTIGEILDSKRKKLRESRQASIGKSRDTTSQKQIETGKKMSHQNGLSKKPTRPVRARSPRPPTSNGATPKATVAPSRQVSKVGK